MSIRPPAMIIGPKYGTKEWHDFRRGLVTASRWGDVLTEPRSKAAKEAGDMSDTARSYLLELVAATFTGLDKVGGKSAAMDRGIDKESDAIDAYLKSKMIFPEQCSEGRIIRQEDTLLAATPDHFVDDGDEEGPGQLEVKCPDSKNHLDILLSQEVPEQHHAQVLGQLEVTGRQWCDFVSFDDRFKEPWMHLVVIRVYPSPVFAAESMPKIRAFADRVQETVAQVRAMAPDQARAIVRAMQALTEGNGSTNLFDP